MKKVFLLLTAIFALSLTQVSAQNYKNAIGLGLDFGDGSTLAGPSFKHFFNSNSAGQAELLFGDHSTRINLFYQYQQPIKGAQGLDWYIGGGPGLNFFSVNGYDQTNFLLIPMAGLDFKIPSAPLALSFDWRPTAWIGDNSDFQAGRFGFGFRFTF